MQWERNRAKVAQLKKLYVTFLLIREYFILCIYSQEHSQLVIHMSLFLFLLCICSIKQNIVNYWVKNRSMFSSVQFISGTQSCPTLCDPMNRSTPGLPVHHQLPKSTQTHVHRVSDAIEPSHPLLSPSPPAPNPSQHQGLGGRPTS